MNEMEWPIGGVLMRIAHLRHGILESAMREMDILPSQHFVLMQLSRLDGAPSQMELAQMLHVSPASVARTIKSLDADGYICRNSRAEDSRKNEIRLTDKGARVVARSHEIFQRIEASCFAGFSREDMGEMYALLMRMMENLSRQDEEMKRR